MNNDYTVYFLKKTTLIYICTDNINGYFFMYVCTQLHPDDGELDPHVARGLDNPLAVEVVGVGARVPWTVHVRVVAAIQHNGPSTLRGNHNYDMLRKGVKKRISYRPVRNQNRIFLRIEKKMQNVLKQMKICEICSFGSVLCFRLLCIL